VFLSAGGVSIDLTESQWLSPKPATMFWSPDYPLSLTVEEPIRELFAWLACEWNRALEVTTAMCL